MPKLSKHTGLAYLIKTFDTENLRVSGKSKLQKIAIKGYNKNIFFQNTLK